MDKIKWGIVGTGRIAHKFAEALNGCEEAELCAVASRSKEKADAFAEESGSREAYGSYEDFAEHSDAEAVYIATPMASHFNDAMLCLEHGKNVLCEKTVTLNSAQLEILLKTADENGLFFMEAMWMKCRPVYLKAKEWAMSGRIGDIRFIKADFSNTVPYDRNDRLFRPDCGGGALLDLAVYPVTLAADFLGNEPSEIISNAHIKDGIDLSNTIIMRYPDGSYAAADSGFELTLRNNAVISGTKGMIVFGDGFFYANDITLYDENRRPVECFSCKDRINGYEYEIREFCRCLSHGLTNSTLVPRSGTVSVMRILDVCRRQWGLKFPQE
ncbi:MAG TPA: Gfo/Idh/MocA family oxidoreductase [Ruminococcus sp.]|nr:Gfo/Idh/MocA family oxidoreductase [Ruminococcus sp.]